MAGDDGRVEFFSSKRCPPCDEAERILKQEGVSFLRIDVDSTEGSRIADKKGIRAVPTIVKGKDIIEGLPSNLKERLGEA